MELVLIRHAEPVRIEAAGGRADPELHERGRRQADAVAAYLRDDRLAAMYTSPLRRAVETAAAISTATAIEPWTDDDLAEYDRDSDSYIPIEELRALKDERWQEIVAGRYLGDDDDGFMERIEGAMARIVAHHPGERVAVVCHGGVINHYVCGVLGLEPPRLFFEPKYASITRVAASRQGVRSVVSLNETAHLRSM
jgi:broad specificity phosphatase PhoE